MDEKQSRCEFMFTIQRPDGEVLRVVGTRVHTDGRNLTVYAGREPVLVVPGGELVKSGASGGTTMTESEDRRRLEDKGREWSDHSEPYLVGYVADKGQVRFQNTAMTEMQRRLLEAIQEFNGASDRQALRMIRLTWGIVGLTIALGVIAGLQWWTMLAGGY